MDRNYKDLPYPYNFKKLITELQQGVYRYDAESLDDFFSNYRKVAMGHQKLITCKINDSVIITLDMLKEVKSPEWDWIDEVAYSGKIQRYNSNDTYDILIHSNLKLKKDEAILARYIGFTYILNKIPVLRSYDTNGYDRKLDKKHEEINSVLELSFNH